MNPVDISSAIIPEEIIRQKLPSIFVDSIMLDYDFNVIAMSQNVLDMLEFRHEEAINKNINYFSGSENLAARLRKELECGYFEDKHATIFTKTNRSVAINISGFYLGLISDING